MELTIQQELGKPNTYQAEVLLGHGNSDCYETVWFMLEGPDNAKLLADIYYKEHASGWLEQDCSTEDVAARIAAILKADEAKVCNLIGKFHRSDAKFNEGSAAFSRLRLHYFDNHGVWHRVFIDNSNEIGDRSQGHSHF
jgi:hypothetical protein